MKFNNKFKTKLKVGDVVRVQTGKYKGLISVIEKFIFKNNRVIINDFISKKILKKVDKEKQKQAFVFRKPTINLCNIMAYSKKFKVSSKIKYQFLDKKKIRVLKKTGEVY